MRHHNHGGTAVYNGAATFATSTGAWCSALTTHPIQGNSLHTGAIDHMPVRLLRPASPYRRHLVTGLSGASEGPVYLKGHAHQPDDVN